MKRIVLPTFGLVVLIALMMNCKNSNSSQNKQSLAVAFAPPQYPDYCPIFPVPAGTTATYKLSQSYPDTFDVNEARPWTAVDFKTDYKKYMQAVLDYCMEGNEAVDFRGQDNNVRKWYSTPWMHDDGKRPETGGQNSGREFLHGLTREITIPAGTLGTKQRDSFQTYAIAYYNAPGGYTIGKVWKDAAAPDIMKSDFPDGTVCFKLLFTEADTTQVPYLANSKQWTANIFVPYSEKMKRVNTPVRLLQLDIAIKDKRATETKGWIYGTFIYDASQPAKDWVGRMVPVGLMWGDDPTDTTMLNVNNQYNPSLKQSVINQALVGENGKTGVQAYVTHLGMGGRMNGPVDNPISSCISCHARAAINPTTGMTASIANFGVPKYTTQDFKDYFSELPCGVNPLVQNGKTYYAADYSFQIVNGIRNYIAMEKKKQQQLKPKERGGLMNAAVEEELPMVSRDGSVD